MSEDQTPEQKGAANIIEMEKTAFKAVTIANGSAIIALLAFLGNIAGKGGVDKSVSTSLRVAMVLFALGVFSAIAGTVCGYFAALNAANPNFMQGLKIAMPFHMVAIGSLFFGALMFLLGAIFAVFGLT